MGAVIGTSANFSIAVATVRPIPGDLRIEELLVQRWDGLTLQRQACRQVLPLGLKMTEQDWDDSPFSTRTGKADSSGLRRCLQPPVVCWPNLGAALDLLSRLAGWLPDATCHAWDFQDLWRAAYPQRKRRRIGLLEVARAVGAVFREPAKPDQIAPLLAQAVHTLNQTLGLERLQSQVAAGGEIDFSRFGFSAEDLERIPDGPGVYWMSDRGGTVFYVGKSKNLYRRIQSYFVSPRLRDEKLKKIHARLFALDFVHVGSELEALLEEVRAIEKWRPEINLQLEVRERQVEYYRDVDLILVLPATGENRLRLFLLRRGRFAADFSYGGRKEQRRRLQDLIQRVFFSEFPVEERWETHILQSFLRQNLEVTNHIDVRQASGPEQCLEWIETYRKGETGGRTVFQR